MIQVNPPHDITAIPVFPWEPSLRLWILVLAALACSAALTIILLRSRHARSLLSPLEIAMQDLMTIEAAVHLSAEQKITLAHITVKKALGILAGFETSHLTTRELENAFSDSRRHLLAPDDWKSVMAFLEKTSHYMYAKEELAPDGLLASARSTLTMIKTSWDMLHTGSKKNV